MQGHGSYQLNVVNQVVVCKIFGTWNKEAGEEYFLTLKGLTKNTVKKPWAMLFHLNEWGLGTPESDKVAVKTMQWLLTHNVKAVALIFTPNQLKSVHLEQLASLSETNLNMQTFSNESDAVTWLTTQGFSLNPDE